MTTSTNQATANALALISAQYNEAISDLPTLEHLLESGDKTDGGVGVRTLELNINSELQHMTHDVHSFWGTTETVNHADTEELHANTAALRNITTDAQNLENTMLPIDPGLSVVLDLINNTVSGSSGSMVVSITGINPWDSYAPIASTLVINKTETGTSVNGATYLGALFTAFSDQVNSDSLNQQIQTLIQDGGSNQEIMNDIQQLRLQMMSFDNQEGVVVTALQNDLNNASAAFLLAAQNAQTDAVRSKDDLGKQIASWFGVGNAERRHDEEIEQNALVMRKAIKKEINLLTKLVGLTESFQFTEILQDVDIILQKMLQVMQDPKLSSHAKVEKVVALAMFAFQLIGMIQSIVQNQKSANEEKIAQANAKVSELNIQVSQNSEILLEDTLKEQQALGYVQDITMVAGLALSTVMGGLSGFIVGLTLVVLTETKALNKFANWIVEVNHEHGGHMTKAQADWIVTAVVVIASVAGGMALDALIGRAFASGAATAAADAAVQASKQAIDDTVDEAVQAVIASGAQNIDRDAVQEVVTDAAYKAAKQAAEEAKREFFDNQIGALIKLARQGTLKTTMNQAMEKAAIKAAEEAVQMVKPLAEQVAANGIKDSTEKEVAAISKKAFLKSLETSDKGVIGKITSKVDDLFGNKPSQFLQKIDDLSGGRILKAGFSRALSRASLAIPYSFASTNYLLDAHETKKEREQDPSTWLSLMQELMMLKTMISLMGSGSLTAGSLFSNIQTASGLALVSANTGANFAMAKTYDLQADAETGLRMCAALQDLLHSVWKQIHDQAAEDVRHYVELQQEENKTINNLAMNMYKGETTGIEVLSSQAV